MKKIQVGLILAAVVVSMFCFSFSAFAASFSDISGHWAEKEIEEWGDYGIIQGYEGKFRPNDNITRGEMAAIIDQLFSYTETGNNDFKDLREGEWYTEPVLRLYAAGVMSGYQGLIRPEDTITREEAVSMIGRACHMNEAETALSYTDAKSVSSWAKGVVGSMTVLKYVSGYDNYFRPQNPMTRAEVITVFNNMKKKGALVLPGEVENTENKEILGIDVSYHNGVINWEKVKNSNVDYVMIRVGYRGYETGKIVLDEQFKNNIEGAADAGLGIGIYFFSQAITVAEAEEEADYVVKQIEPYRNYINYPVVFDWEKVSSSTGRANKLDKETLTKEAFAYLDVIETNGYLPMLYFNRDLGLNHYNIARLTGYDFWYAYYGTNPQFPHAYTMWQYSEKGRVNGVSSNVDMNVCYKTYAPKTMAQQLRQMENND